MKGLVTLLFVPLTAFSLACSDAAGPEDFDLSGRWSGSISGGGSISLTLAESESGNLSGSGSVSGPGGSIAVTVASGTHSGSSVSLSMTASGFEDLNFSGTIQDRTTIQGTLNGSGFDNVSVTLTR